MWVWERDGREGDFDTHRAVSETVPGVVDADPPGGERALWWVGHDVRRVRGPLFDFVDEIDGEVVV